MAEEVVPVYAQGFYVVNPGVVNMVIIFDYLDKAQYYYKLLRKGGEELAEEISTVWDNMQRFMDEEIVRINGQRVRPVVREVYIGLRGSPTRPYITFIGDFPAPLRGGETSTKTTTRRRSPNTTTRPCGSSPRAQRLWSGGSRARWRPLSPIYSAYMSQRGQT